METVTVFAVGTIFGFVCAAVFVLAMAALHARRNGYGSGPADEYGQGERIADHQPTATEALDRDALEVDRLGQRKNTRTMWGD